MKKLIALVLIGIFLCQFALAEETVTDGYYDLRPLLQLKEGEEAFLTIDRSYYSGDTVYKGRTGKVLTGACALHCGAVMISNLTGREATGQQVAKANNRDIREESRWIPFVSWGKVARAFHVDFKGYNMASYRSHQKKKGTTRESRRIDVMKTLIEAMKTYASTSGLAMHYNSTGRTNGSGHKHAVVLLGYIEKDGVPVDLLLTDSSVPAPQGACVRLSESSLPNSMLGQKKADAARLNGDNLAYLMMDYVVSYRYCFEPSDD